MCVKSIFNDKMGQNLSLEVFQIINDVHIILGSGILGVMLLLKNGMHTQLAQTLFLAGITFASYRFIFLTQQFVEASKDQVIFITGCDSGLGFSFAQHACELGFTVFAGCLNSESEGANVLSKLKNIYVIEVDITKDESVKKAIKKVDDYLLNQPEKGNKINY